MGVAAGRRIRRSGRRGEHPTAEFRRRHLALTWKIVEGEFQDRQLWQRITFVHSSEQAQTIGRKTLKDLCVALDVNEQVGDAGVFLFKPARIRVGIEKDKQGLYPDKNRISRILPPEANPAEPEQPAQATAAKASSPAAATRAPKSTVGPAPPLHGMHNASD